MKKFLPILLLAGLALPLSADQLKDGPQLFLPKGSSAGWLVKPAQALPKNTRFGVDAQGRAFLLIHPQLLRLPTGEGLPLKEECRDLLLSSTGRLYLLSDRAAGPAELKGPDEEKRTWGRVKEKLLLPGPGWRLADGGSQGVLAYGYNPDSERYEVYRLKDKRKLLDSDDRIHALAEDEGGLVAAVQGRLLRLGGDGSTKAIQGPAGGATGLASLPGLGLAASHPTGLSLLRPGKKPLPLLSSAFPKIRSQNGRLYVMLREGGILKLAGLDALKDLP